METGRAALLVVSETRPLDILRPTVYEMPGQDLAVLFPRVAKLSQI
jgi:hypothetical protein